MQTATQKIKKSTQLTHIELEPTSDILKAVAQVRAETGFPNHTIGFAAESQQLLENARTKLHAKSLDLIIANDISAADAGFDVPTNRVTFLFADGRVENRPLEQKSDVADAILQQVCAW